MERCAVITVSDRAAAGESEDLSGPAIVDALAAAGYAAIGPRDRTPDATKEVIDRELPGVAELRRAEGRKHPPHAALTRGPAGVTAATTDAGCPPR